MKENILKQIVIKQKKQEKLGIYSCCSANEFVLRAAIEKAKRNHSVVLIESTANQVDQNGGYTGMKPIDFHLFVEEICNEIGYDMNKIILGGDHLGPLTWAHLKEEEAMKQAEILIMSYVEAGFTKIHVDTSMKLASDNNDERLSDEIIAKRGARLIRIANETYQKLLEKNPQAVKPVYIIGSEVPIPGGANADSNEDSIEVTKVEDLRNTLKAFKNAFDKENIMELWEDVIAVVVQPGIEEKDTGCTEYDPIKAKSLMNEIKQYPGLVYEGHSTDYQTKKKLRQLVEDGVAILKVGPALTFALREGLFSLAYMEDILVEKSEDKSNFIEILEKEMLNDSRKWDKYYLGSKHDIFIKRKFSFSDRCRYYLPNENVNQAVHKMINNLSQFEELPLSLISQFLPQQYIKIRECKLQNNPEELLKDKIGQVIDDYLYATKQELL